MMSQVCLLLEETYPYVMGGVSKWTHTLINNLPEIEFSILHIHTGRTPTNPIFTPPVNLTQIVNYPLQIERDELHLESFMSQIPNAKIYHALSTGFAGFIGTKLKEQRGTPFLLTEHGIYWHEIELGVDEVECGFKIIRSESKEIDLGLTWSKWAHTFREFAYSAYQVADQITTVSESNRRLQISLGAEPEKCKVIHNGIDVKMYNKIYESRSTNAHPVFGLIARVTPIKDILTFIKAAHLVKQKMSDAVFYCIGPIDHNRAYYTKCQELVAQLQLKDFFFTREAKPEDYYKIIDMAVLSSISEGQPLVLLEAMASGIPVIASDVGGCKALVYGEEDGFGKAGYIFPVGDYRLLSTAMLEIVQNNEQKKAMGLAGRKRTQALYSDQAFTNEYRKIYNFYEGPVNY